MCRRCQTIPSVPRKPFTRDRRLTIRVTPAAYESIERAAAADRRTVAGWITALIDARLEVIERKRKPKT